MKPSQLLCLSALALSAQLSWAQPTSIPVGHLDDAALTDGFKKSMVLEGSGYIRVPGEKAIKAKFISQSEPGISITEKGQSYLKVTTRARVQTEGETVDQQGYSLIDPKTLTPKADHDSTGEVTVYKTARRYPESMKVGSKLLIAQSQTFEGAKPVYVTTNFLTLALVNGETNLYQLCESSSDSKPKAKSLSESDSCLLIDRDGQIKGYALLIIQGNQRSTFTGTVRFE